MPRPRKECRIERLPEYTHYKPSGMPLRNLDEVVLTFVEMEAMRLSDIEQLDQGAAAERLQVSRPTFHRIITTAHQKLATALWEGKAIRVEGGHFRMEQPQHHACRQFTCQTCGHTWSVPFGTGQRGRDMKCEKCGADNVHRSG